MSTVDRDPASAVDVVLLGRFAVTIDGSEVDPALWRGRPAAALVKLLALSADRRLHREQVIDARGRTPRSTRPCPGCTRPSTMPAAPSTGPRRSPRRAARCSCSPDATCASTSSTSSGPPPPRVDHDDGAARERALRTYRGELLPDDRYEAGPSHGASTSATSIGSCSAPPGAGPS